MQTGQIAATTGSNVINIPDQEGGREILTALKSLDEEADVLEKALADARNRLEPVMTPDEPTKDGPGAEPIPLPSRSPVAGSVRNAANRVAAATRQLYAIMNRLEV